jgi:hypothetical protein
MGREVHFVIAVDVDNNTVSIDDDTYAAKFDYSQGYYDTDKEQWFEDEDRILYDLALGILNNKAQLERE